MGKIIFSEKQINDILHKYTVEKISKAKIAKSYNVSASVITRILQENNIKIRDTSTEIPEEIVEKIIDRYVNQHYGLCTAGSPWGYSQKVVETILKKANIRKRNYTESKQITRLYQLDDNFFKKQNSNMAYILGFLAADGNVASKENSISIQLQKSDEKLLQQIQKIVKSTRPLDYYTTSLGHDSVKFQVWSAEWKKDLAIYNIVPNKTFILQPPTFLDTQYSIDYIRGYFDGDGSVSYKDKNPRNCVWEIVGASKDVITWIYQILAKKYQITTTGILSFYTDNNVRMYKITYCGIEKLKKIYSTLYANPNCLCLERKKQKIETILE